GRLGAAPLEAGERGFALRDFVLDARELAAVGRQRRAGLRIRVARRGERRVLLRALRVERGELRLDLLEILPGAAHLLREGSLALDLRPELGLRTRAVEQ